MTAGREKGTWLAEIKNNGGWKSPQVIGTLVAALLAISIGVQSWTVARLAALEERENSRAEVAVVSDREMVRVMGLLAERVASLEAGSESWLPEVRQRLDRIEDRLDELTLRK
jgi:hypothetical protein